MRVTEATIEDLPDVVPLGSAFAREAQPPGGFDPEVWAATWTALLGAGTGVILLARDDSGRLLGMLGGVLAPNSLTGHLMAVESFWYVSPPARGMGVGPVLLDAFEGWAHVNGAEWILMVALSALPEAGDYYHARGYESLETHYVKEL